MTATALVELSPTLDADEWAMRHAAGEVPDRVPYGLHRLADEGISVLVRRPLRSWPVVQFSRVGAKLSGGVRWPENALGRPSPSIADVRLFWDERSSISALLMDGGPGERTPVVTGVIWNTEPSARLSPLARWVNKTALRRADSIYVLSSAQVPVLRAEWGIASSRIHFVPFGIDTDFWDPASPVSAEPPGGGASRLAREQGQPLILSVGNDRHRDHELLLTAVREVHARLPAARLELVTSAPQQVPAEVGRWRPSATHRQLRDLYRKARVAAICTRPNIHGSGMTAILESMAMGKAVIATHTPGLEDYIVHGETGVLVPSNNPVVLARELVDLLADPDRCARLGAAARQRALRDFSTQAMCGRLADVIRSVIQPSSSSPGLSWGSAGARQSHEVRP
jgi:glycosyltransferase involved in cell wall biosynthesis